MLCSGHGYGFGWLGSPTIPKTCLLIGLIVFHGYGYGWFPPVRDLGTPVVWEQPTLAVVGPFLGYFGCHWTFWSQDPVILSDVQEIWTQIYMKTQGLSDKKGAVNIKKVIRELHDMLRYKVGMKHLGAWPLVGVVPPSHEQSGVMWCAPNQKGFVRKGHFLVIFERSFDVLCYVRMRIMFVCSLLRLSVWSKISVLYFYNVLKRRYFETRQGRSEMVRGKARVNVHYLATILLYMLCARICNVAKLSRNGTRQCTGSLLYVRSKSRYTPSRGNIGNVFVLYYISLYIYLFL